MWKLCLFRLFMHQGKRLIITKSLLPIFQFYIYEARHRQNLILAILAIEKSIPKSDLKKWIVTENIVSVNLWNGVRKQRYNRRMWFPFLFLHSLLHLHRYAYIKTHFNLFFKVFSCMTCWRLHSLLIFWSTW